MSGRFRPWLNVKVVFSVLMAMFSMTAHSEGLALPDAQEKKPRVSIPFTKWAEAEEVNARKFWKILSNDLGTMGPFRIVQGRDGVESSTKSDLVLITQFIHGQAGHLRVRVHVQDARTQKPIYRKIYDGSPVWIRRMAHRIADDFTEQSTGRRGTAESRIVFAQETRKGVREIFQVDQDGEGITQLTHHQSLSLSPTLASDGRLAYITYKGGPPEIWGQRKPGGPNVRLFPMGSDHSGVLLTPAWSPVCNKLAFVKSDPHGCCNVMVLDLDRNSVDQLTHEGVTNSEPAWDPTGKRIAFTSDRSGTPQIYMMESDGSSTRRITAELRPDSKPSWNPDGSQIAFVSKSDGLFNVFVVDIKNGVTSQITKGTGSSNSPTWSPDGRWIAFTNSISGASRLMVSDLLGRFVRPLGLMAQVQAPEWSRSH